ncbi:uncharacterized protein PRCAT00001997001 [Priceomyces carsonii]|uniref:uncharacterized protein n=1 Tax=Priceomyces carsonii TaxID=28549 RepID=UPI002ED92EC3|nr:unnamed protein product [Priceomyces carsonii]
MTENTISEALDFGGRMSSGSITSSHLSLYQAESAAQSLENVKRIKPNTQQRPSSNNVDNIRDKVQRLIHLILHGLPLEASYNSYYNSVEILCRCKHNEKSNLSTILSDAIDQYFREKIMIHVEEVLARTDLVDSVNGFVEEYEKWDEKLMMLSKLFLYLDRGYLLQHPHKMMIAEMGKTLFVENIIVKSDLVLTKHKLLLQKLRKTENNEITALAKRLTKILVKLNFNGRLQIHNDLIDLILSDYSIMKESWIEEPQTYVPKVLLKISKEITYFKECGYSKEFLRDLLLKLKWILIFLDFSTVIHVTLPYLIHERYVKELEIVFGFAELATSEYQFDSFSIFIYEWGKLVFNRICDLITDQKGSSKNIIPILVDANSDFKNIATTKLAKNEKFEFELRVAFNKALNQSNITLHIISQLCKYCDSYLRNSIKKGLGLPFNKFQNDVMTIFKAINDKDGFIQAYKNDLSRRLLLSRSANLDEEQKLVDLLLKITGETDNSLDLQIMFKDLQVSRDCYSDVDVTEGSNFSFNALILEKKVWPEVPRKESDIKLPSNLGAALDSFSAIYHSADEKRKNHVLDWSNYALHQLIITANFDSGPKELIVNLLQAIVILLFNDKQSYKFTEIQQETKIDGKLLKRVLGSLTRFKVLMQKGQVFEYNSQFEDKSFRIRIPLSKDKETSSSGDSEQLEPVKRNRESEVKAAIVQIMKISKSLPYSELLVKSLEKLEKKGAVSIHDIKLSIEGLIDSDYLAREEKDKLSYIP